MQKGAPRFDGAAALLRVAVTKHLPVLAACVAALFFSRWLLLPLADALALRPGWWGAAMADVIRISLNVAAIAIVALPFQWLWPAIRRRPKCLSREYWLDWLYWHQGLMLQWLAVPALLLTLNQWLYAWLPGPWFSGIAQWPFGVQVLMAIWLFDLVVYWRHRSEHVFGFLWSFHAVHHSTKQVDVLTTLRLHPLEIFYGAVTNAAVLLVGFGVEATGWAYGIYTLWNYYIHTNVKVRFSGPMKYVLVTPFMHQWHHALDREAMGKNVGVVFAWNDWLFGSAYHPEHWPTQFGIDAPGEEQMPQNYFRQLLYPLQYAWVRARRR